LASQTHCSGCGSLRSDKNKQLLEETRGINDWTEAAQKAKEGQNMAPAPPKRSLLGSRFIKLALFGIGAVGILFITLFSVLIYLSTLTYPVEIEVSGLEWQRSIALEEY